MRLNLSQSAHMAGVSKTHLSRLAKQGKLSVTREDGQVFIDVSELQRLYPNAKPHVTEVTSHVTPPGDERLREVTAEKDARISLLEEALADLREDRDRWRTQAERLLLSHQPAPPRPNWWARWLRR